MGARELVGEPGIPLFERLWARPTFEVHGIRGGFTGEGAKTVIPARAVAKISTRLVADQDPKEAAEQLKQAVAKACPRGVTAELKAIHSAPPSLVNPDNRFIPVSYTHLGIVGDVNAVAPGLVAEGRIGDYVVEGFDGVAVFEFGVGQRVSLLDDRPRAVVQDHVHAGEAGGGGVLFPARRV